MKLLNTLLMVLAMAIPLSLYSQLEEYEDIDKITKKGFFKTHFSNLFSDFTDFGEPFAMNGGVGINLRSYSASGGDLRQDPFFYSFNTNLNARVYKLNLPFSLVVTARNQDSSLPSFTEIKNAFKDNIEAQKSRFVRFGISPQYKWIKLHFGHRTMNFSKFTLSNLNFYGVGGEFTPGNWNFAVMKGRLAQAEPIDLSLTEPNFPRYQREGWGMKFGYGNEVSAIEGILFKGHDEVNSIIIPEDNPDQVSPEENVTLGLNAKTRILKKISINAEFGYSVFSNNSLDALSSNPGFFDFLMQEKNNTEKNNALDLRADYEGGTYTVGLQFKRIEPNYRSLGAYFFNNDIIDILGNLRFKLLDDKANMNISAGVQSNNLRLLKPTTTTRLVYSGDFTYGKDAFNINLNYSNNSSEVGYVLNQALDSLNAVVITQSGGANITYSIPDKNSNQHIFTLSANIQMVSDDIENPVQSAKSQLINGNLIYNYSLKDSKWKFTSKLLFNQNELSQMLITRYGVGFGISKALLEDKMNIGFDLNQFWNTSDVGGNSTNLSGQFRMQYRIAKSIQTNMSWNILRTGRATVDPFSELTGIFGIQYNFSVRPFQQKKADAPQEN